MICVSINQESRRLALADMVNAKHFCDIMEVRLDRFGKSPEIGDLMAAKGKKPVIMTCRRPDDGGFWDGTEADRLTILRQCIISKAEYVEIELDAADDIRPFPPSKRVISYTNLKETPPDILEIYDEMKAKRPDVIKLVTLARTPEEAWPLVQILAKAAVPTVVVGLGKPGVMLSVLSQKIGAPWVYAALERGMEAYPGQPTVSDLDAIYRLQDIEKTTKLIGVTGFSDRDQITVAALNALFHAMEMPYRCLPIGVGNMKIFRKIMEACKLNGAVIADEHQASILDMDLELHGLAKETQSADVVIRKNEAWHGVHLACKAWMKALTSLLATRYEGGEPIKGRLIMIAGLNPMALVIARDVQRAGGSAILACRDKKAGQVAAQKIGCRYLALDALYSTMHDVLIVCENAVDQRTGKTELYPSYLKPGMFVMDLTAGVRLTTFLREAQSRTGAIVQPLELTLDVLELQAKTLIGKDIPRDLLRAAIPERFLEEA